MVLPHPSEALVSNPSVIPLPTLYRTWGAWLKGARTSANASQRQLIEEKSLPYFRARHVPILNWRMYSSMERDERIPLFEELEPLYRTFAEGFRLTFSDIERDLYLKRARERIEAKRKKAQRVKSEQWDRLAEKLAEIDGSKHERMYLLDYDREDHPSSEEKDSRRLKALADALRTDTSHLLEREQWVCKMLTYPVMTPPKKLVTIQGHMGIGKSHALALLTQRLALQSDLYLIPYRFESGEGKTPDDHLAVFLATILSDLIMIATTDDTNQCPLEERIDQVLTAVRQRSEQGQKVILLLDDAQEIFPSAVEWSSAWEQFFQRFVRESHTATIYGATRIWPGWMDRRRTYVEQTELADLSPEAGIMMWQRFGFSDVPEDLLRQASIRCGGNPQMIEMRASHLKQRPWAFAWGKRGQVKSRPMTESEHTTQLKTLLEQDSIFDPKTDAEARKMLQHVVSSRLSHPALRILECLAVSPLGLPLSLLEEEFPHVDVAFDELIRASLIDLGTAAANRAAAAPLIREAQLQTLLSEGRKDAIEARVTDLYAHWLANLQEFRDDAEKAGLIAEMVVRYIRMRQMLKAAELFISYGWLCALFGHTARIQRVYDETTKAHRGQTENAEQDVGQLLLSYHILTILGEKVNPRVRDSEFHHIRDLVLSREVTLQPHPEIYLAYTLMSRMIYEKRYQEAYNFLEETMNRISKADKVDPEVRASFLHNKANLLGRWSSHVIEMKQPDEATRLRNECVDVLTEVTKTWRACLTKSLPIQERYFEFKLARALNDLAYYSRILGYLEDAEKAIMECLYLKEEKKATLPRSLAVSLGEYAQILKAQGRYQEADVKNDQAIQHIDKILQSGDSSANEDKGMLLVERANICEMQGRLEEAKQLLRNARSLLGEDRDAFRFEAEQQLARIQVIEESSTRYQMDSRWYGRYLPLAKYDDLTWLAQAGPFTVEEQHTWDHLYPQCREPEVWQQLAEIIKQSKQREFELSAVEGHLPHILYPAIDIDDVRSRMRGFSELKETIEREEANIVVRRLYERKIDEHLFILRLVEATYKQDITSLRTYNETLYGKISKIEMTIALREFFKMLKRAQNHPQAKELAEQLLKQLKQWHLFAEDFIILEDEATKKAASKKLQQWRRIPISSRAVQHLYEEALKFYGFTEWQVIPSPERDGISLDLDLCALYLPTNDRFSVLTTAEFLTEEIETHMRRSVAGKRSKLALLSSGTRGYLPTEEGLAALAIEEMMDAQGLGQKSQSWTTTLSPGMAMGILTPPQSFGSLYDLFAKAFLANHLQSGRYETVREAEEAARYDALVRISRTFRGIPNLEATGVCNLKDRVYLQGYREVSEALTRVPKERLFVGSIGIHDLGDMEELHILQSPIKPLHLAHDPQLFDKIMALEKQ